MREAGIFNKVAALFILTISIRKQNNDKRNITFWTY